MGRVIVPQTAPRIDLKLVNAPDNWASCPCCIERPPSLFTFPLTWKCVEVPRCEDDGLAQEPSFCARKCQDDSLSMHHISLERIMVSMIKDSLGIFPNSQSGIFPMTVADTAAQTVLSARPSKVAALQYINKFKNQRFLGARIGRRCRGVVSALRKGEALRFRGLLVEDDPGSADMIQQVRVISLIQEGKVDHVREGEVFEACALSSVAGCIRGGCRGAGQTSVPCLLVTEVCVTFRTYFLCFCQ